MKKSFSLIGMAFIMLLSINTKAQIAKVEIVANGLTCSMCSNAINKKLKSIAGIEKVTVDLNENLFVVEIKKGSKMSPSVLKNAIEKAGFFVGSMTIQFDDKDNLNKNYIFLDDKKTTKYKVLDKGYCSKKDFKTFSKKYGNFPTFMIENENDFHLIAN